MTGTIRSAEQRVQDFTAMGHSVDLINDIMAGNQDDLDAQERQNMVNRNVEHLQIMVAKTDWEGEDMTNATSAISSGQGYTAL